MGGARDHVGGGGHRRAAGLPGGFHRAARHRWLALQRPRHYPHRLHRLLRAYQLRQRLRLGRPVRANDGKAWIPTMLLTASLFPVSTFAVAFVLNTIAIFYHSLAAIPFGSIVVVLFMWGFISFPLMLLGTVVGRNWNGVPDNPCRIKTIPRTIPEREWYLTPTVIALAG